MALFEKCCCCVPLRLGCLILGYISLIGAISGIVLSLMTIVGGADLYKSPKGDEVEKGSALIGVGVVLLIVHLVYLAFCILLLVGIHTNNPGYVKAFLIFAAVFIAISVILLIGRIITGVDMGGGIGGVFDLAICIYFFLVLLSYYEEM